MIVSVLAAALLAGCGTRRSDAAADDSAAAAQEDAAAVQADSVAATPAPQGAQAQTAGTASNAPITLADVERWQRGIAAELQAVREAGEKLHRAKTAEDTVNAMFAANEMGTRAAGAKAAGVDEERYQFIRTTLSSAVSQLTPVESEMNVKDMPPAMLEEMKKGRETAIARMSNDIPPDVMDTLRQHAVELRKRDMGLVAARLETAGLAQQQ